jgi:hypothetical protein
MNKAMVTGIAAVMIGSGLALAPGAQAARQPSLAQASVSVPAKVADQKLATRLVNRFFTLLHDQDAKGLATFLSPAFQLQRPDGSGVDKGGYLASPAKVDAYEISGLTATRAGDSIVARYTVTASETVNGQLFKKDPAPRLSVFKKNDRSGSWQLLAHANFNAVAPPT